MICCLSLEFRRKIQCCSNIKEKYQIILLQNQTSQQTQTDRHKHEEVLQQQSTQTGSALVEP